MPWVRKVHAVRKYFPNRLEIEMALRTPVGWAESRGTLHLVDADGVCLPRTASARDGTEFAGLPVFTGLTKDAPEAGKPWADESLRAGLSLAGLIQYSGHPATERVVRIDCKANQAAVVENIVVFTDKGTAIYWGKPSYASNPLELAPEKKLANLLGLLEYYDDQRLATYRYIDLRYYEAPRAGKLGLAQKTE
jgi:cell division septal protein FtsQ